MKKDDGSLFNFNTPTLYELNHLDIIKSLIRVAKRNGLTDPVTDPKTGNINTNNVAQLVRMLVNNGLTSQPVKNLIASLGFSK